mmetsp:Transcript_10670/g.14393  ORF Transcript_10670/g.14393 Transcript_10670/m.14393 type:complete len:93 (+) Transcript_10670:1445-1723(+)
MRILGRTAAATILLTGFPPTFLAGYAKRHEMKSVAYVALTRNQRKSIQATDCFWTWQEFLIVWQFPSSESRRLEFVGLQFPMHINISTNCFN